MTHLVKKIITMFTSRLRSLWLLKILQKFYSLNFIRKISIFFDPNYIRKVRIYQYKPKIAEVKGEHWKLYVDINDHIGFRSFIENRPFENSVYQIAKKISLTKKDVILDIGANIGSASIPICAEIGCELAAIEASKENTILLLKNIAENNVRAHVSAVALTNANFSNKFIKLYLRDGNRGASSLLEDWNKSLIDLSFEMVPTITLDEYIQKSSFKNRIGLIKIDVEGAELDVIKGGSQFLKENNAPILMEYRANVNERVRENLKELLTCMTKHYSATGLDKEGNEISFDPSKSYENILFKKI